jgi:hypothetical protein
MRRAVLTFDPDPYKLAAQRASATEALAALEVPPVAKLGPRAAELARDWARCRCRDGRGRAAVLLAAAPMRTPTIGGRVRRGRRVQHVRDGGRRRRRSGCGTRWPGSLPPVRADDPVFNSKPARQGHARDGAVRGRNIFGGSRQRRPWWRWRLARIESPGLDHGEAEAAIVAWRQQVGCDIARRPARRARSAARTRSAHQRRTPRSTSRRAILDASNARCIKASVA